MQKILFILLTCFLCMATETALAYDFQSGGIYYSFNDDGNSVTVSKGRSFTDYSGDIDIPSEVTYSGKNYKVTSIGKDAFAYATIKSVSIPNTVTEVGTSAFSSCTSLTKVNIANLEAWCNIKFANDLAQPLYCAKHLFINNIEVKDLVIPNSITEIKDYAFHRLAGNITLTIPNTVTKIGKGAFTKMDIDRCFLLAKNVDTECISDSEISSLYIGPDVTLKKSNSNYIRFIKLFLLSNSANSSILSSHITITSKDYPLLSSYFEVGDFVYVPTSMSEKTCVALDNSYSPSVNVIVPQQVEYNGITFKVEGIAKGLLAGNNVVNNYTIECDCPVIPEYFAYECASLLSAQIPCTVNRLGNMSFYGCENLSSLIIEESENELSIDPYSSLWTPFDKCPIKYLVIGRDVSDWKIFQHNSYLETVDICGQVSTIGSYAFERCSNMKEISISSSVKNIQSYAILDCKGLNKVHITDLKSWCNIDFGITAQPLMYAHHLYLNDEEVTDLIFPPTIENIKPNSFEGCHSLRSVIIPNSVKLLGYSAFKDCVNLNTISLSESLESLPSHIFSGCTKLNNIILPNSITTIGMRAFDSCSSLSDIVLSNSIKKIESGAFYDCTNLGSINLPTSLSEIDSYIFSGCTNLKTIHIPANVSTISDGTFYNCYSLSEFIVYDNILTIGESVFRNCSSLKELVIVDGDNNISIGNNAFTDSGLEKLIIGRNIIGKPFNGLKSLRGSWVTDNVTSIPEYLFYQCNNLEYVYFGNGISEISSWSLSGCSSLKKFYIGENILSIGANALSDCGSLTDIFTYAQIPPTVQSNGLDDINKWNCTLHYPEGTSYTTANQWKEFILSDNNFRIAISNFDIKADKGSEIVIYATVDDDINPESIIWCSSNSNVAYIISDMTELSNQIDLNKEENIASVRIKILNKRPVSIAAFTPSGLMASCTINSIGELVSDIVLNETDVTLNEGQTVQLTATVSPELADNKTLQWTSSNEAVASVDQSGLVTAVAQGNAVITVSSTDGSEVSTTCNITVSKLVASIVLSENNLTLKEGEFKEITATILPDDATNADVVWTSYDESVATVQDGLILAHKLGTAIIRVEATDGSGIYAECTVEVTDGAGIEDVTADGIYITTEPLIATVHRANEDTIIRLFDMSSKTLYIGTNPRVEVGQPGFYILVVNNKTYKIKL